VIVMMMVVTRSVFGPEDDVAYGPRGKPLSSYTIRYTMLICIPFQPFEGGNIVDLASGSIEPKCSHAMNRRC